MPSREHFDLLDPQWLPHRHFEPNDSIRFIKLPRASRTSVPFLTDANLGTPEGIVDVPLQQCLLKVPSAPVGWLFHSAFCGSTLLAQVFDSPGVTNSLSEPMLLNDIVGFRRRGGGTAATARLGHAAIRTLARPFSDERATIIKPSNVVNPLAEMLLALEPDAPAIFLYAPLETFLISVARKGLPCRLWVRELLEGYLDDGYAPFGYTERDYFRQSDLQVAALGWLAQHMQFNRIAGKHGTARLATLDADKMIANPALAVEAAIRHWRLELTDEEATAIMHSPAFSSHSKGGAAFSAGAREAQYRSAREAYAGEIDLVVQWAEKVADAADISTTALNPLLH